MGIKREIEKVRAQSKINFEQLLDVQIIDKVEDEEERKMMLADIVKERKLRLREQTELLERSQTMTYDREGAVTVSRNIVGEFRAVDNREIGNKSSLDSVLFAPIELN